MTPDEFARIESLFHAVMTKPPERRQEFLQEAEANPTLRAVVERLLEQADTGESHPLSARLAEVLREVTPPPQTIGPYRLVRELGAGGMGTVFLAEREVEGVRQQVALKILHGLPTEQGKRRLATERGLLAGLNHPQIAGHIDGGETADGQPFLVMEYVEGVALPEHLETYRPTLEARLRLFLALCDAVAHAHQRLILHRDLKPSNVIVRAEGTPVLLDFGVGKLLEESQPDAHTVTRAFTPGYAAPEQHRGLAATMATDVFGLGAVLFDLVTDLRLSTSRQGDAPVPAPSSQVTDATRRRALRGDLDRIVRKATADEPEQRYPTSVALAEDVERYLAGRPIIAAPPALGYRARKFVTRHRWAVAASLVLLILAGAFVWRLDVARQRAVAAESIAAQEAVNATAARDFLVSVLSEAAPEHARGQPITVASLMTNATERLQADTSQDWRTRTSAWLTIAEVHAEINDPQAALSAADAALSVRRQTSPADADLQGRALRIRTFALSQLGRHDEAQQTARRLIALRRQQDADALARSSAYHDLSGAYYDYGRAAVRAGELDAAEQALRRALALVDASKPDAPEVRAGILQSLVQERLDKYDLAGADRYFTQAEAVARAAWSADHPEWIDLHHLASELRNNQGNLTAALAHAEEARRLAYRLLGERSLSTLESENDVAAALNALERHREALHHLERARAISEALDLGEMDLATLDINMASVSTDFGDYARAIELASAGLAALPPTEEDSAAVLWHITAYVVRGDALRATGRIARALADLERAVDLARSHFGASAIIHAQAQIRYTRALAAAGRRSDAEAALAAAREVYEREVDAEHPVWIVIAEWEARLALDRGDLPTAKARIEQALADASRHASANPLSLARVQIVAAQIALEEQETATARALVGEALPVLRERMVPEAPQLVRAEQLAARLSAEARADRTVQ